MFYKMKNLVSLLLCLVTALTFFAANYSVVDAKGKKNIVVVLDPGHDSIHNGCQVENFDEAIANLYIAYYCKQELEKYDGVTVYMTRYGFDSPSGDFVKSNDLAARVNIAKSANADVMISLHNDYSDNPSDCGAKVIIPNPNFKPEICAKGQALGQTILSSLTNIGLRIDNWRYCPNGTGIVTRDAENSFYPDGSAKDYYAIINRAKTFGFPCLIVEHAYCSNFLDKNNYLSTTAQYQALGTADATGIAKYYGLKLKPQ